MTRLCRLLTKHNCSLWQEKLEPIYQKFCGRRPFGGGTFASLIIFSKNVFNRETGPPHPIGVTWDKTQSYTMATPNTFLKVKKNGS